MHSAAPGNLVLPPGGALPSDAPGAFVLQGGRAEVYAVLAGHRLFLAALEQGAWAFIDPALLTVLPDGGHVVLQPASSLDQLAADPFRRGELITRLDGWIETLAAGVARHMSHRPAIRTIGPGEAPGSGEAVAPGRGTVWADGHGGGLFDADAGAGDDAAGPLPVPPSAWLIVAGDVTLRGTADVVRAADWTWGLQRFHTAVAAVLSAAQRTGTAGEKLRLQRREAELDDSMDGAVLQLRRALTERIRPATPSQSDSAWALQQVAPGAVVPPGLDAECDGLEDLAERCGLHARRISLSGQWWRADRGRLLTRRLSNGRPVVLVPDWRGRPRAVCQGEAPVLVDARQAADLDPAALEIVRPLPPTRLRIRDLVRHGLHLCRHEVAVLAAALLLASLLALVLPYATAVIVNVLIPQDLRSGVVRLGAALGAVTLGHAGLGLCSALARTRMDGRLAGILQSGVLDRALRLPLPVLRSISSSDLTLRVLSIDQLRRLVTRALLDGVLGGIFGLTSLVLLFTYSPAGGLVALLLAAILLAASFGAGLGQVNALMRGETMTANLSSFTLQLVQNVVTLRAFGAERRAFIEWLRNATEMRRRLLLSRFALVNYEASLVTFHGLALAGVYAVIALGTTGAGSLSLGASLAFVTAFQGFLATSEAWGRAVMQLVSSQPMFARAELILNTPPEVQPGAKPPGRLEGRLSFSGIAHAYGPSGPPVLTDVEFEVGPGQFVALVGGSGSGKTTLLSLALGFARPDRGAVLFDNKDLSGLDLAAVRRQVGIVRQSGKLLGGSLLETIRGMHNCSLEEAWHAAELAAIAGEIRAMPMGMHTAIIEGSAGFSGGQIQRLLLARALAGKPRLLILDEATSALDNVTQAQVVSNLVSLGISMLVVAHRLSTIRQADAIHFLYEGRIAETGRYDSLMRAGGLFADFARRQTL